MNIFKQLYINLTYNRRKYIKINNKNIYNYLTEEQIMYFDKKYIYFLNDLNILINDSIFSWLIIDKNKGGYKVIYDEYKSLILIFFYQITMIIQREIKSLASR